MEKTKSYYRTKFSPLVLREVIDRIAEMTGCKPTFETISTLSFRTEMLRVNTLGEFLADYAQAYGYWLSLSYVQESKVLGRFHMRQDSDTGPWSRVAVELESREQVERVFQFLDSKEKESKLPNEVTVFIGHGRDQQWRDLKDHLTDHHNTKVIAYEVGPRAGKSVKEVLQEMLSDSSFALLVLTGEDERNDGTMHARENVVHELGLFQGRLGFTKALALLEDGVTEFSNILGLNQIRFAKGRIKETYGDVLATIKREFPDS